MDNNVCITLNEYRKLIATAAKMEMLRMDVLYHLREGDKGILAVDTDLVFQVTGLAHYNAEDGMEAVTYE